MLSCPFFQLTQISKDILQYIDYNGPTSLTALFGLHQHNHQKYIKKAPQFCFIFVCVCIQLTAVLSAGLLPTPQTQLYHSASQTMCPDARACWRLAGRALPENWYFKGFCKYQYKVDTQEKIADWRKSPRL